MIWQLLVLQIGFFILLLFLLQKLFHGLLYKAVSRMEKLQNANLKKEDELKRAQNAFTTEIEKKTRETDTESKKKKLEAETEARAVRQSIMIRAEEEKEALLRGVKEREAQLERRYREEAMKEGAKMAAGLVRRVFSSRMFQVLHESMAEELLGALGENHLPQMPRMNGTIKIDTAYPLSAKIKEELRKKISELSGAGARAQTLLMEEAVDPSLLAGFTIRVGELVLDGSLKNRFEKNLEWTPE